MADTHEAHKEAERRPKRTRGGHKAVTWQTYGVQGLDTWRTHGGHKVHMADKWLARFELRRGQGGLKGHKGHTANT